MLADNIFSIGGGEVYFREVLQVVRNDGDGNDRSRRGDFLLLLSGWFYDDIVLPAGGCQKDEKTKDDITPGSYQFRIFLKS